MHDQLVGYVLGALDDSEHADLEQQIADDSSLERKVGLMSRAVEPLAVDRKTYSPPAGLAQRTCDLVDSHRRLNKRSQHRKLQRSVAAAAITEDNVPTKLYRWSFVDVAVAAGILAAATLLLFPVISHSRFQARVTACQNNLAKIGQAFQAYGESHQGQIPEIPQQGTLAVAGVYAPRLIEAGLVTDPKLFVCGGSELACSGADVEIPSYGKLVDLESSGCERMDEILVKVGGSYAYNLGYVEDGHYQTISFNSGDNATKILLADAPCKDRNWRQSSNHGGHGQNALFADGHVRYLTSCSNPVCIDTDIYHNDDGEIAAGRHARDIVVGQSAVRLDK